MQPVGELEAIDVQGKAHPRQRQQIKPAGVGYTVRHSICEANASETPSF
jgi:hypothetical protein